VATGCIAVEDEIVHDTFRAGPPLIPAQQLAPPRSVHDDPGSNAGRRLTGWSAIVAAVLAWFTVVAVGITTGGTELLFDPREALNMSQSSAQWFRAGMLADSLGFYFSFVVVGGYLWSRFRSRGQARADMAVLAIVIYALLGIAGAVIQFATIDPLMAAHDSPDAAVRAGAESAWLAIVYATQRGLWWFEGPAMAIWALFTGSQLRGSGFKSWWLLVTAGLLYAAYFVTGGFGALEAMKLVEAVAVIILPLWLLVFGVALLRNRENIPPISLRASASRWVTGKLLRPILTSEAAPATKRAQLNRVARFNVLARRPGTHVTHQDLDGVPVEWVRSRKGFREYLIIYFHGGGYVVGSPLTHRNLTAKLAKECRAEVAVVDYRLAPEHPFPAAPHDALTVYKALLADGSPAEKIVLAGDSAGAGLVLACAIQARDAGLPMPSALICLSPWSDLSLSGISVATNESTDALLTVKSLTDAGQAYLAGENPGDPLASPQFADLSGLPPTLIQVTDAEILYSDAVDLAAAADAAGVETKLDVSPGLWHVWHMSAGQMPEADEAIRRMAGFIAQRSRP
jgi:acetyl esterase/lipase